MAYATPALFLGVCHRKSSDLIYRILIIELLSTVEAVME
jgi:hypothetical protein